MKKTALALAFALAFALTSCNEKESSIGLGLQDPATLYQGTCDTLYGTAVTVREDSLNTTNNSQGLLGFCSDNTFGSSEAWVYAQIAYTGDDGLLLDGKVIDSAFLSLSLQDPYPASVAQSEHRSVHFQVSRLAAPIAAKDDEGNARRYYYFDTLAVDPAGTLFDGTVDFAKGDTAVRLPMGESFISLLRDRSFSTNEDLNEALRGIRIRILDDGTEQMYTLNFNASCTGVTLHCHPAGNDTTLLRYMLSIGTGGVHFNHFRHQYAGTLARFNSAPGDSLDGTQELFLMPMGGARVKVSFDQEIKKFHVEHPNAIIHYAELRLPLASEPGIAPDALMLLACNDSSAHPTADFLDGYTASSLQLGYNSFTQSYNLRITQHLQRMLRKGEDPGTLVVINGRLSSPKRMVAHGTHAPNATRIILVYSEL